MVYRCFLWILFTKIVLSVRSELVVSVLGYVSNPRKSLIARLFDNLQITHLDARNCKVRNFEFNLKKKYQQTELLNLHLTWIGGFPSISSDSTDGRPKEARIRNSFPPGKLLICHETADFSGNHLQFPVVVRNFGESASDGTCTEFIICSGHFILVIFEGRELTGTIISTLLAVERRLNWERALTMISTREWACFSMWLSTQISGFIWV